MRPETPPACSSSTSSAGSDFGILTQADLETIAQELNENLDRPSASRHQHEHSPRCCDHPLNPLA
jgi:hypothetical protein